MMQDNKNTSYYTKPFPITINEVTYPIECIIDPFADIHFSLGMNALLMFGFSFTIMGESVNHHTPGKAHISHRNYPKESLSTDRFKSINNRHQKNVVPKRLESRANQDNLKTLTTVLQNFMEETKKTINEKIRTQMSLEVPPTTPIAPPKRLSAKELLQRVEEANNRLKAETDIEMKTATNEKPNEAKSKELSEIEKEELKLLYPEEEKLDYEP